MVARQTAKITPLPTQPVLEKLLTLKEVGEYLQIGRDEIYRLIREEGLPVVPFGENNRRVRPASLARWIEKREESHGA